MGWWIIRQADGTIEQVNCPAHPSLCGACRGGWNLDGHYRRYWRGGPDVGPGGQLFIAVPFGQTIAEAGHNPNYIWTVDDAFWRWTGPGDETAETDSADIPDPLPGFAFAVELEREALLEIEDVAADGTISASLEKHRARALGRIEAKAAPVLTPAEPAWKQAQHEAKRQEVHFWSSGRRSSLDENFPLAWAEVRRKWPAPSLLNDVERVGDVIATYRAAMLAAVEITAPVEAWRVASKEAVRAATTVAEVEAALTTAMEEWPE